ncbi:MAG: HAD family hydrolase [Acidiferrobacterales bacterium]|nr:HAD family hydrolase [Acidiferrobacterales bacterium]
MKLKGILFDKDGTLLDFNGTWLAAYRAASEIIADYSGGKLSAEEILIHGGYVPEENQWKPESVLAAGSSREILASWNSLLDIPLDPPVLKRIGEAFHIGASGLVPAVDPLFPCMAQLRESGFVLGIATMDSEKGAIRMAESMGIANQFDFICGADSGFGEKPDPGMVQAFVSATGIEAAAVVMVGDSPRDIMMGINARVGMSVGVTSGAHSREELLTHTDHVLDHIGYLHDYLLGLQA